jgi:Xaa-Pro aminopeptidase
MMLEARRLAHAAVRDIALQVTPGMLEEEGLELARRTLRARGFERDWVEPCLRFGVNTLKKYAEPSEPGVTLGRDDVWFIDVGPLWHGWECDVAETFAVGDDPERHRLVRDIHEIYDRTCRHWREARATGTELYRFAADEAALRGWQLDLDMCGHRLGRFPHAEHYDGSLAEIPFTPSPGMWMLELQIRHPDKPYGAFVEDLLIDAVDR